MSTIRIQKYTATDKAVWDNFVANAKNATFLFYRDFMDYHKHRFEDASLLIYKDNQLIALLPANKIDQTIYSHQGLSYGGLILHHKTKFKHVLHSIEAILMHLESLGITTLKLKMLPKIYTIHPNDELDYLCFLLKAKMVRSDLTVAINLEEDNKLSTDRRAGVKRGIQSGLIVKEEEDFIDFWNSLLVQKLNEKHGVNPVHSLEEISLLKASFSNQIKQFNVYHNDELVAGTTLFETTYVVHSQYIAANADKNKLGALDFLHDYLINKYRSEGKKFFDFGISNEEQGKVINEGLLYWKEGFGARSFVHQFYEIETKNYRLLEKVFV